MRENEPPCNYVFAPNPVGYRGTSQRTVNETNQRPLAEALTPCHAMSPKKKRVMREESKNPSNPFHARGSDHVQIHHPVHVRFAIHVPALSLVLVPHE